MSHYLDFKTAMTDPEALKRALTHMKTPYHRQGLPAHCVEVHDKPQSLYGYQGDERNQKAEVIIRRNNTQDAANDIGFVKNADGCYDAIISEYDRKTFHSDWLTELSTYYNFEKSKIELEARKIPYEETKDETGRLQLRCQFKKKNKGESISL